MTIEALVIIGACGGGLYAAVKWLMKGERSPEPWGTEVEEAIHGPDAVPVCHRCFAPQKHDGWFCPACGTAVGPYNNYLPYVYIFSQGEVLRAGVNDHIRPSKLNVSGFVLMSLSSYWVFAPLYWYFLAKNLRRQAGSPANQTNPSENGWKESEP